MEVRVCAAKRTLVVIGLGRAMLEHYYLNSGKRLAMYVSLIDFRERALPD
jgi:hypothetical protein